MPDLSFVYGERLPPDLADEACPVPVDLAIEISSPDHTFSAMAEKATDYVSAGVARVWVEDPTAQTITAFKADTLPVTYRGTAALNDSHFPGLSLTAQLVFQTAGLLSPPPSSSSEG